MPNCPACADSSRIPRCENKLTFRDCAPLELYACRGCGHRWLKTDAFEQAKIETRYDSDYAGFKRDDFFRAAVAAEIARRLPAVVGRDARVLDVGCGNCDFIIQVQSAGYRAEGIDVSPAAAALGRQRGLKVEAGDFRTHAFDGRFDVISFWDVLEHLREPETFLRRARYLLQDAGVLWIKIPSFGPLNFSLLQFWRGRGPLLLGAPDHVQFYTRLSLERLLARSGFARLSWFESRRFRARAPTSSWRRLLGRRVQDVIGWMAGNQTLYLFAYASAETPRVDDRLIGARTSRLNQVGCRANRPNGLPEA